MWGIPLNLVTSPASRPSRLLSAWFRVHPYLFRRNKNQFRPHKLNDRLYKVGREWCKTFSAVFSFSFNCIFSSRVNCQCCFISSHTMNNCLDEYHHTFTHITSFTLFTLDRWNDNILFARRTLIMDGFSWYFSLLSRQIKCLMHTYSSSDGSITSLGLQETRFPLAFLCFPVARWKQFTVTTWNTFILQNDLRWLVWRTQPLHLDHRASCSDHYRDDKWMQHYFYFLLFKAINWLRSVSLFRDAQISSSQWDWCKANCHLFTSSVSISSGVLFEGKLFAREEGKEEWKHTVTHEMQLTMPFEVEVHELPQLFVPLSLSPLFFTLAESRANQLPLWDEWLRIGKLFALCASSSSVNHPLQSPGLAFLYFSPSFSLFLSSSLVSPSLSLTLAGETNLNYWLLVAQCIFLNSRVISFTCPLSICPWSNTHRCIHLFLMARGYTESPQPWCNQSLLSTCGSRRYAKNKIFIYSFIDASHMKQVIFYTHINSASDSVRSHLIIIECVSSHVSSSSTRKCHCSQHICGDWFLAKKSDFWHSHTAVIHIILFQLPFTRRLS